MGRIDSGMKNAGRSHVDVLLKQLLGRNDGRGICRAPGPSCRGHLRRHGSFALKFGLVPFEGLLSAVFELVAIVVFGQAMRTAELCTAMGALSNQAKDCRVAWSLSLKLATFLSGHVNCLRRCYD